MCSDGSNRDQTHSVIGLTKYLRIVTVRLFLCAYQLDKVRAAVAIKQH